MNRFFPIFFCFLLVSAFLVFVPVVKALVYEDFTSFVEVDPNSHISVASATHVDFQDYRNEDAYLYKDYGINYFGTFTYYINVKRLSGVISSLSWYGCLANTVDDMKGLRDACETAIGIEIHSPSSSVYRVYLAEFCNVSPYMFESSYYTISLNTWYYMKVVKSGISLSLYVYGDSGYTNLLATLSLTLHGNWNFRYVFACNTWNSGNSFSGDSDIKNLGLEVFRYLTFYFNLGGQFYVNTVMKLNGTQSTYLSASNLGLVAIPLNGSYVFESFNWSGGSAVTNPYNYTVSSNMTLWCFFGVVEGGYSESDLGDYFWFGVLLVSVCFVGGFLVYRRSKTRSLF